MGKKPLDRIPKTLQTKLGDLDDHVYLLRIHLHCLREDLAHLKALSAELRTLACLSSGAEGLLWRLCDELRIPDAVNVHLVGSVQKDHPLAQSLHLALVPVRRAGYGDPRLTPSWYPLRDIVKRSEAVFVRGQGYTHEYLIKAIAQQMGSSHEDDGIEPALSDLGQFFFNGVQPYVEILAIDADLVLQVAERVLDHAVANDLHRRKKRPQAAGNLTLVARLGLRDALQFAFKVFTFRTHVAEVEIICLADIEGLTFSLQKRSTLVKELTVPFPPNWRLNEDAVFAFSYSSAATRARVMTSYSNQAPSVPCDLGWLEGHEILGPEIHRERESFVYFAISNGVQPTAEFSGDPTALNHLP